MKGRILISALCLLAASSVSAAGFKLTSPQVKAGGVIADQQVFNGFGCTGGNVSPALSWKGAPAGTKSFALTVYDPDAPTGSGWWHWVVYNIPASAKGLPKDFGDISKSHKLKASQGMTDYGAAGFGGACPPKGDKPHRYFFTVHALDVAKLDADPNASPALLGFMINAHSIAKATILSYYGR